MAKSAAIRDSRDIQIVRFLLREPTAEVSRISQSLNIPQSTVQKRLSRMEADGCVERGVKVIDWAVIGYPLHYWIDIRLNFQALRKTRTFGPSATNLQKQLAMLILKSTTKDLDDSLFVEDVIILLGSPADLSVSIRARDHRTVLEFVTNRLRMIEGVDSTTTFHAAWSSGEGDL